MDWLEKEKTKLKQLMDPVIKVTKMWLKHTIREFENEGVKCTYNLMGDLDSHSTFEESTE